MQDFARPGTHEPELSNVFLTPLRSSSASLAMYLAVSVLPSSTTSGALPPARAASSFVRWSGQLWYSTLTVTPGCLAWNAWFVASTMPGQLVWASTCSQTVMPSACFAAGRALAPPTKVAATAVVTATADPTAARCRSLMWFSPCPGSRNERRSACGGGGRRAGAAPVPNGSDHRPRQQRFHGPRAKSRSRLVLHAGSLGTRPVKTPPRGHAAAAG